MTEEMGGQARRWSFGPASALVPWLPPPPPPLKGDKVPEVPQEGNPWFASDSSSVISLSAPPSTASVGAAALAAQTSTDLVAAIADGQVREGQRGYTSIQPPRKMEFPKFCKNFNGLHMVGIFGCNQE